MKQHVYRSPLKASPLHNPSQSLDHEIQDFIADNILGYFLIVFALTVVTIIEIGQWYANSPPQPGLFATFAVIGWGVFLFKYRRSKQHIQHLKQGRDGEKAVGQYLEGLREQGASVFHDIPANGFNIDHVIIARQGVFAIETKTLSKPAKNNAEIEVKCGAVLADGKEITRNPLTQTNANAEWLAELLKDSTGRKFPVRPVLVFPGWFVKPLKNGEAGRTWVLNPKALPTFIANEQSVLSPEDVKLAAFHLSRYIRVNQN